MEGYCLVCKSKQHIQQAKQKTTSNGRHMMSGSCPKCGTTVNVFVSKQKSNT
jgi:DNA polymerase II large subunit